MPTPNEFEREAAAVTREAYNLERETLEETAELLSELNRRLNCDPLDDRAQYRELRRAVAAVVELAYQIQDPLRDSPYAGLAAEILTSSVDWLDRTRHYKWPTPTDT